MKNVQDIYPVSPMQEFMLLHALAHKNNDSLFNQFCYSIESTIDTDAFAQAWRHLIQRHAALRTAFVWTGVKHPQQVVRKIVTPALTILDWRNVDAATQALDLAQLRDSDRATGFDLRRAPLVRFTLVQLSDRSWYFMWSSHHLILDRWCLAMIFHQFDQFYAVLINGESPAYRPAPSFRNYIQWIHQQNRDDAMQYWRKTLALYTPSTRLSKALALTSADDKSINAQQQRFEIFGESYTQLEHFARTQGVTVGTVIQGAYALAINQLCKTQDVVFGAAVSGRPVEVAHVEEIVGSFINNVPVRVQLPASARVSDFLKSMQAAQFGRHSYEFLSPADIHQCSGLSEREVLFDSLLVWLAQDETQASVQSNRAIQLPMTPAAYAYATAFPLTLSIEQNAQQGLICRADTRNDVFLALPKLMTTFHTMIINLLDTQAHSTLDELPLFFQDNAFDKYASAHAKLPTFVMESNDSDASLETHALGREDVELELMQDVLMNEWRQILDIDSSSPHPTHVVETQLDIDVSDYDFFELGGDSIQAALLHLRIEAVTRKSVPILALFQHPTIRGMATTLSKENWPLHARLATTLRSGGQGVALFCIASPEVNTIGYSLLSRYLPDEQKVYVLQAPPKSRHLKQLHPSELPALAQQYAREMRKIQPQGPYRLLSMCAGSHITLHMVRQLERDQQAVEFFGIINTWALYTISRLYYLNRALNVARYYKHRAVNLLPVRVTAGQAEDKITTPAKPTTEVTDSPRLLPADEETGPSNPWIRDVGFAHMDPKQEKIKSTISVFRLKPQQFWRVHDHSLGWSRHASSAHAIDLPGDSHDAMMREPRVRDLGDAIGQCLEMLNSTHVETKTTKSSRSSKSAHTIKV